MLRVENLVLANMLILNDFNGLIFIPTGSIGTISFSSTSCEVFAIQFGEGAMHSEFFMILNKSNGAFIQVFGLRNIVKRVVRILFVRGSHFRISNNLLNFI